MIGEEEKQPIVASSVKAQFNSIAQRICELLWLIIIISYLQMRSKSSMTLYCGDRATINIEHNPIQYDWTKHVDIDRHFIKRKKKA